MKASLKNLLVLGVILISTKCFAQVPDYNHLAYETNSNFYSIRDATQHYYDSTGLDTVKGSGYKQFKRWAAFWETRVGDESNHGSFQPAIESFAALAANPNICNGGTFGEQWQFAGHSSTETTNSGANWGRGQGILLKVYVDMVNDGSGNTIYVGSQHGGLWRSRNAKSTNPTWVCITNNRYPGMGVNDITIDPSNSNIMYISTGMGMGDDFTYGMGILKTTNGQSDNPTWNTTGLSYDLNNPSSFIFTQGVFMSPSSNSTIFALMKNEIWKSTNGGTTFVKKHSLTFGTPATKNRFFRDLVFLPSNSSTIFASSNDNNLGDGGAVVLKSTDNGENWSDITTSLGFTSLKQRIDLAVTANNTNLVLAGGGSPSTYEISKSQNSGANWTKNSVSLSVNVGYWENDIVISPNNEDVIFIAGTTLTKSTNGGTSFTTLYGYWDGIVHPDIRGLFIRNDGNGNDIVYTASDGGINVTENSGSTWKNLNGTGLTITEIYGFDMNLKKDWIAYGCQDLGFYNSDNGTWKNHCYGDGIRMIFNPFETTETMYGQSNYSGLHMSTNRGATWDDGLANSDVTGSWEREMAFDALGNLYVGYNTKLYRKKRAESTFTLIGDFPNAQWHIWGIGISKSDPNTVYIGFDEPCWTGASNRLFKSTNALSSSPTWTDKSANLPCGNMGISDIVVDPNNSDKVWIATGTRFSSVGGSQTADRIHFSQNGGSTFTTIKCGLNIDGTSPVRFPINSMVIDEATGGMYIGTDIGVYYNPNPESASSCWVCFNKDMPTSIVTDLKIDYCNRKILASTYGRGLWESNLAESAKKDYVLTASDLLNINAGETRIYYSDITIPNTKTLVVKGLVRMAPGRKITVKIGGKILIDGGKITSTCDLPWGGIRVEGTSNQNQQNLANLGFVQMINNATVENATNAISLIGLNTNGSLNWAKTGGLIQATNSNFVNNKRDVEFMSYHPIYNGREVPNRSFFINCQFITNSDNKIPNDKLIDHVTMWDVTGVQFRGCTFQDLRPTIIAKQQGRTGITTIQSTYTVTNNCPFPYSGCTTNPSKFINLKKAINSFENGKRGIIIIENSQFTCYKGVFLQATTSSKVVSNTYNIGHDIVIPLNTDYPYGLYLDKCQLFWVEGNQFTGTTGITNVTNGGAAGLVIRNTGENNNEFYRNNFDNIKMASQALSENRKNDLIKGLRFRCNDYEQNFNDLDVRNDLNNPAIPLSGRLGIAELQGQSKGLPPVNPDNDFGNSSSILNFNLENKGDQIQYIHSGNTVASNRLWPSKITTRSTTLGTFDVFRFRFDQDKKCPNLLYTWGIDRVPITDKLNTIKPLMMGKVVQQKGLTDGGNTQGLLNSIETASTANVNTVFNQLLGFSPYLSHDILVAVAAKDLPFSLDMVRDVLLANPQSSRSLAVQTNLDNRINPLPAASRQAIDNLVGVFTHSDTLGWEVSALVQDYDINFSELTYSYLSDTNSNFQEISPWLKHPVNQTYHYQLAEMYFNNDDWDNYLSVKDSIPLKFNLDSRQQTYHDIFSSLYSQLHTWQLSGANLLEPDSMRKVWLLNFISSNTVYPAKIHALLAVNDTLINHPDVYVDSDSTGGQGKRSLDIENDISLVSLYPNPSNTEVTLKWKEEFIASKVKVFDINGRLMLEIDWNIKGVLMLKVDTWPAGVYFVNIETSKEKITRKLLINN